jgi:hypothetical protein
MINLEEHIFFKYKFFHFFRWKLLHLLFLIVVPFFSNCMFNSSVDKNKMFNGFFSILASMPPTYNLEGSITNMTSQHGKFILSTQSEKNYVYVTEDDQIFKRYEVKLEGCTPENLDPIFTICKILSIGYDGSTYAILGVKEECQTGSCSQTQIYFGISKNLDSFLIKPITIPNYVLNSNSNFNFNNILYENGVFHFILLFNANINGTNSTYKYIYYYKNETWYFLDISSYSNCNYLYLDLSNTPSCSDNSYYNSITWTVNSSYTNYLTTISTLSGKYYATLNTYNNLIYNLEIKLGSGNIQSGINFYTLATIPNTSGGSQLEIANNRILTITAVSTTNPPGPDVAYFNSVYSTNGNTFTNKSKTIVPPYNYTFTQPVLFKASSNYFYFSSNSYSSNKYKSILYRSKDGIEWNQVTKL